MDAECEHGSPLYSAGGSAGLVTFHIPVSAGDVVFTTLGFVGLYLALGMLFVMQVLKEISRGPQTASHAPPQGNSQPEQEPHPAVV